MCRKLSNGVLIACLLHRLPNKVLIYRHQLYNGVLIACLMQALITKWCTCYLHHVGPNVLFVARSKHKLLWCWSIASRRHILPIVVLIVCLLQAQFTLWGVDCLPPAGTIYIIGCWLLTSCRCRFPNEVLIACLLQAQFTYGFVIPFILQAPIN